MNTPEIETRLKQALAVTIVPRSIVDDVVRQLPRSLPKPASRSRWRLPVSAASLAGPVVIAATLAFFVFFTGTAVRLVLADIQTEVDRQAWVHIKYDVGPIKECWTNLQTGEAYITRTDGTALYVNDQTNTRLWILKNDGVIRQEPRTPYAPGKAPPPWTPRTAWEQIVAPLERAVALAVAEPVNSSPPPVVRSKDLLDGKAVIRFDSFTTDSLGNRILSAVLWADPATRLPVRVKTRLQPAERNLKVSAFVTTVDNGITRVQVRQREIPIPGREWSTGDYDFPAIGPVDFFAVGVPAGTPNRSKPTDG